MSKETYAEAFEVWHKSDLVLRGDDYYDVLGFMQDADREIERLEAENEKLKHNTDAIWDIYQSSKRENAALREKLAAAKIPKEFEQTVEKLKQALALGGYPDLISAASYVLQMWDAWRGEQKGAR